MKKHLLSIATLVLALCFGLASCNESSTPVPDVPHGLVKINDADFSVRLADATPAGLAKVNNVTSIIFQTYINRPDDLVQALNIACQPFYIYGENEAGETVPVEYRNPNVNEELENVRLVVTRDDAPIFPVKGYHPMKSGKIVVSSVNADTKTVTLHFENAEFEINGNPYVINGEISYPYDFV